MQPAETFAGETIIEAWQTAAGRVAAAGDPPYVIVVTAGPGWKGLAADQHALERIALLGGNLLAKTNRVTLHVFQVVEFAIGDKDVHAILGVGEAIGEVLHCRRQAGALAEFDLRRSLESDRFALLGREVADHLDLLAIAAGPVNDGGAAVGGDGGGQGADGGAARSGFGLSSGSDGAGEHHPERLAARVQPATGVSAL